MQEQEAKNGITLSWFQLANHDFQRAINEIWNCPMMDAGTSYTAHRIKLRIDKADKEVRNLRIEIANKYAKKDEAGKPIQDKAGYLQFEKPEDAEAFEQEFVKEFEGRKVTMKISKMNFQKLTAIKGITPRMWEQLVPIVDNFPKEEDEDEAPVSEKVAV